MKLVNTARVAAAVLAAFIIAGETAPARADTSFGFYFGRPGVGFYIDRTPRYRYNYYPYRYYRYAPRSSYRSNRCNYWSGRCAEAGVMVARTIAAACAITAVCS